MADFELDIKLSSSSKAKFNAEIKALLKQYTDKPIDIKIKIDDDSLTKATQQLKDLKSELLGISRLSKIDLSKYIKVAGSGGGGGSNPPNNKNRGKYSELIKAAREYNQARVDFEKIGGENFSDKNLPNFKAYESHLDKTKKKYDELRKTFSKPLPKSVDKTISDIKSKADWDVEKLQASFKTQKIKDDNKSEINKQYADLKNLLKEYNNARVELAKTGVGDDVFGQDKNSKDKLNLTNLQSNAFDKYDAARQSYEGLRKSLEGSLSTKQLENLDNIFDKTSDDIEKVRKQMTPLQKGTADYQDAVKKVSQLMATTGSRLNKWTAAKNGSSKESYMGLQNSYQDLITLSKQLDNNEITKEQFTERFKEINTDVSTYSKEIRNAGESTQTFSARIAGLATKFTQWLSVSQIIMLIKRGVGEMITNVKNLDTAMTELKKVTNETDSVYSEFLKDANSRAQRMGATVTDTITATADYARLGYSLKDASELADASIIYKNVGDGISNITDASESIISTMKAFNIEASNSMSIVDKFNEVGNNFAISSKGVGDALLNSASSLATANNSLDESIALITAGNTTVQNPEKVGTALKTISMYLRAAKTDAEEAGESTDGMANSVSELRSEILALTGGKVDIQIDKDTFKSTYEVLRDLSSIWNDLSDLTRANIIEKIGGKRNANVVTAILNNFEVAEDVIKTAADSSGSAISENEKYLDSIEGKTAQFKATFEETSAAIINSGLIKHIVDGGTKILDIIGKINSKNSLIPTATSLAAIITLMKGIKGQSSGAFGLNELGTDGKYTFRGKTFGDIKSDFYASKNNGGKIFTNVKSALYGGGLLDSGFKDAQSIIGNYNKALGTASGVTDEFYKSVERISPSLLSYFKSLNGADATLEGYKEHCKATGQAVDLIGEKSLASAAKVTILNVALNVAKTLAITAILSLIAKAYDEIAHAAENAHEKIAETSDDYKETKSKLGDANKTISDLGKKYEALSKGVNTATNQNISLTTSEYEEYLSVVGEISNTMPSLIQGYDAQGNAILSCAGSVDKLTESYKNLSIQNNNKVLSQAGDFWDSFEKNAKSFENSIKNDGLTSAGASVIERIMGAQNLNAAIKEFSDQFENESVRRYSGINGTMPKDFDYETYHGGQDVFRALNSAGIVKDKNEDNISFLKRVFTENIDTIESIVDDYNSQVDNVLGEIKPVTSAYLDNLFLKGQYSNISSETQSYIEQLVSSYDYNFYKEIDGVEDLYTHLRTLVGQFNALSTSDQQSITTFLSIKSKYNNNDCTLEEYQSALENAKSSINNISNEELRKEITISLGINDAEGFANEESYKQLIRSYQQATNIGDNELANSIKSQLQSIYDSLNEGGLYTSFDNFIEAYNPTPTAEKIAKQTGVSLDVIKRAYEKLEKGTKEAKDGVVSTLSDWQLNGDIDAFQLIDARNAYEASIASEVKNNAKTKYSSHEDSINDYLNKASILKYNLGKLQNGQKLTARDLEELHKVFPKLSTDSDKLSSNIVKLLGNMNYNVIAEFGEMFGEIDSAEDVKNLQDFEDAVLSVGDTVGSTQFELDISTESDGVEKLNAAISQSASATGLTSESVENLRSRYAALRDFNPASLFEETANGIHLNKEELNKLEAEYAKNNLNGKKAELQGLVEKYNNLTQQIDLCTDSKMREALYNQRDNIASEAQACAEAISQYEGLTSAYKKWQDARSNTDDKNMYEEILGGKEEMEDLMSRGWMTDDVKTYIDLLSSADLSTADVNECIAAYQALSKEIGKSGHTIWDFFTTDDDGKSTTEGIFNFFDTVESVMGKSFAWKDKDGKYNFDFGIEGQEKVAKALGMDVEAVESLLRAASDAGFKVSFDSLYHNLEGVQTSAEKAAESLRKLDSKYGSYKFNFRSTDVKDLDAQIENIKTIIKQDFTNSSGKIDLSIEGAEDAQTILKALLRQKNSLTEPIVMSIDDSKLNGDSIKTTINNIKDYIDKNNLYSINLEVGSDTSEAEKALRESIKKLSQDPNLKNLFTELKIDIDNDSTDEIFNKLNTKFNDKDWLISNLGISESSLSEVNAQIAETINSFPEITISIPNASSALKKALGLDENGNFTIGISANTSDADSKVDSTQKKVNEFNEGGNATLTADTSLVNKLFQDPLIHLKTFNNGANINVSANTSNANKNLNKTQKNLNEVNKGASPYVKAYTQDANVKLNNTWNTLSELSKPRMVTVYTSQETKDTNSTLSNILSVLRTVTKGIWSVTVNIFKGLFGAGATGTAFAQGNWGAKRSGIALGGELGQELVVRDGRFFTIGDDSAEFFAYKKGDIIFNHKQTKEILSKGKIFSGQKRGRALVEGTAFTNGSGPTRVTVSGSVNKSSSSSNSNKSSGSNSSEDSTQKIDYIEIAIDRLERAIAKLERTATSAYKTLKDKLTATTSEISKVNQEISTYQKAYDKYISAANSVSLSSSIKQKVRDGAIDITEYSSETAELINEYKELYEKALDAQDAISELQEKVASLYENKFNDTLDDFENQLSIIEHKINSYEKGIDINEAKGYLASTNYYKALISTENQNISVLQNELNSLIKSRDEAVNSGKIAKYSSAWYEMTNSINDVEEAIDDANLSLIEYDKTMRSIEWDHFTYLQDEISKVTDESNFLIDLMSNSELYDDKGKITDKGTSTMGLHAMNYDVYMAQADKYAAEIAKINQEIEKDPYDTELIDRKNELLELQRESILSAEDEKKAIQDLVKNGIDKELASLKDIIAAYEDSLDSAKDLYDYQNKVSDSAKEIASLQKQLSAYQNDTSEETKATIQKLKVDLTEAEESLKETEYEHYISEQKKLLDQLYTDYETILNQRLDNIDMLLSEAIATANDNTATISQTITTASSDVGYTLTDNMKNIWDESSAGIDGTLCEYGDSFNEKLTSLNSVLNSISNNVVDMITKSDAEADKVVNKTPASENKTNSSGSQNNTKPTNTTNTSNTTKTITVGGKINAGKAKIYASSYGEGGTTQYFGKDPIYVVLQERNGYLLVRHHSLKSGNTGWFKKSDVKAYKHGGLADFTGLAWMDGTKQKPETVLDAEDSANFLRLTEILDKLSNQNIHGMNYKIPASSVVSDISESYRKISNMINPSGNMRSIGDVGITIEIDHVDDYNDFMRQLTNDNKFVKFVESFTVDRIAGGSALAKNKYKW